MQLVKVGHATYDHTQRWRTQIAGAGMKDIDKIAKVVRETLTSTFQKNKILDIRVAEDRDFDGEEILRVDVLFEGAADELDTKSVSGVVRSVRPRLLREVNESAFPLFSFIAQEDVGAERFEAA